MVFETLTVISRNFNAYEAGEEIGRQIIEKLKKNPTFILLFSTIHYEKYGGFQKFLDSINMQLPQKTPIIGGTVAGFMDNTGCYSRGAVALAVYSNEIKIAVGVGHNTKKNPKKAAEECAQMIKQNLNIKENNIVSLLFTSGPTKPIFPIIGKKWVIKSGLVSHFSVPFFELSTRILQLGYGREEEVFRELVSLLPNSYFLGASCSDNNQVLRNFQFFNNSVFTNSAVILTMSTKNTPTISSIHGLLPTNRKIHITRKSSGGRIISKINGKSATRKYLEAIGLPEDMIDEQLHRKSFFYPLAYKNLDGKICPAAVGAYLKDSFSFSYGVESDELELMAFSGRSMAENVDSIIQNEIKKSIKFLFGVICCSWLETLGSGIFRINEKISSRLSKPYLFIFSLGEEIYAPGQHPCHLNETFNTLTLS
ncbi:MAG: FIST N-terminal domain-containing protein [Candidatus Micrarchaeia archaeon]